MQYYLYIESVDLYCNNISHLTTHWYIYSYCSILYNYIVCLCLHIKISHVFADVQYIFCQYQNANDVYVLLHFPDDLSIINVPYCYLPLR